MGTESGHSPDRINDPWGRRTPYGRGDTWPERVDTYLTADAEGGTRVDRWVATASNLHSNGDAMELAVRDGRLVGVRGVARDRVNHGRLDPKDLYGWQAIGSPDRLTRPLVREDGVQRATDWDTAMARIVDRARALLDGPGPSSIGFYTSGQLFLEEYYALAVLARGGLGTRHLDGNTRLCTATAGEALKESFGCDGQPGSYTDIDHADTIALFGHNVAETQSVLWSRILDRLAGPEPPVLLCVDPRPGPVSEAATVHLQPRPGTNLALMNGLLHEVIEGGWTDPAYIEAHVVGFDRLAQGVALFPAEAAAAATGVPAEQIRSAALLLGQADRLLSTVLQGFYQSHQATAAAVQVNNLHLVRGMLGRPGCGVLQMNGQPTAQNTRECGADGDLPGFRNWANPRHVEELAKIWNVPPDRIPHDGPPTHAMRLIRLAEEGSLRMLWISGTNPAVSLPELARIRAVLGQERLFLVVQDLFPTETTAYADVVLPAAGWGVKTGTFTNADRTVHLSLKAVDPPGEARPDLDIFLDFARRMDLRDASDAPLLPWRRPEEVFEAWKECSRGRPCDYSGLSYALLRERGGVQWPCTAEHPEGTERLYTDGDFRSSPEDCETYGRDLLTGTAYDADAYRSLNPDGKAVLRTAPYVPPPEQPDAAHPLWLITGRTLYQFHTRTRTGRVPRLHAAAPDMWIEMSGADAAAAGIAEGDLAEVSTRRGTVRARVRLTGIREGVVFLPFHYGYWDAPDGTGHHRAANELTPTTWDPASKQPLFKTGAARVTRARPAR
ncbi:MULTISPECIES: nitrate reductase [unclassified Streptomyces]|uniref:molybdopterin oxidoreductase family protein n=1 Tax=unclassified Streptomyces TaxID=2593676 RepID=UPI0006F80C7D|nr:MULTISPECIES: nitrate reductase [unclassified Streptomyces]KQX51016.1 molybdopterin oxidoreductase [Streptomyces sp. Root1304]KRA85182.1 molybdopterin oxidoreductase [Streptomyces sp. Root66D1]